MLTENKKTQHDLLNLLTALKLTLHEGRDAMRQEQTLYSTLEKITDKLISTATQMSLPKKLQRKQKPRK
jgi:pyruvate-formate lyase